MHFPKPEIRCNPLLLPPQSQQLLIEYSFSVLNAIWNSLSICQSYVWGGDAKSKTSEKCTRVKNKLERHYHCWFVLSSDATPVYLISVCVYFMVYLNSLIHCLNSTTFMLLTACFIIDLLVDMFENTLHSSLMVLGITFSTLCC